MFAFVSFWWGEEYPHRIMAMAKAAVDQLPCPGTHIPLATAENADDVYTHTMDECDGEESRKKKHSGPRKRRPKKKKMTDPTKALREAATPSPQHHQTPPPIDTSPPCPSVGESARRKASLRASAVPFVPVSPTQFDSSLGVLTLATSHFSLSSPTPLPMVSLYGYTHRSPVLRPPHSPYLADYDPESETQERAYWTRYVVDAAEKERARRLSVLRQMQEEEEEEIRRRRAWAIAAIEQEQQAMMREMFLDNMKNTQWFQNTISRLDHDYEVVCPNSWFGCTFSCMLKDLETHLKRCVYRQVPDTLDQVGDQSMAIDLYSYDVVCPNAMLGCSAIFPREELAEHLKQCPLAAMTREKEWEERQEWQQNVIEMTEEERQRRMNEPPNEQDHDRFSFGHLQRLYEEQTAMMHVVLHEEITSFTAQCDAEAERVRPAIEAAVDMISDAIRNIWGDGIHVKSYGSFATRLHGGHSDVDLVVFGATTASSSEISPRQQCVGLLAARLSSEEFGMRYSEISAITRASIPLVKVVVTVEIDGGDERPTTRKIPFDITFDDPGDSIHNGIASATLLSRLMDQFYGLRELTLVLKHFLATRGLNDPYVGGLSSYGLVLMILFVLREEGALVCLSESSGSTIEDVPEDTSKITRWDMQRGKGQRIAREVVSQARARQVALIAADAMQSSSRTKKRSRPAVWELLAREHPNSTDVAHDATSSESSMSPSLVSRSSDQPFLLGKLLMDFLQWYGNDFRHSIDRISVLTPSPSADASMVPSPLSVPSSPVIPVSSPALRPPVASPISRPDTFLYIQDPLQHDNNVGKTCYRISQVLRDFSDFLSVLTALIVRGSVLSTHAQTPRGGTHSGGRERTTSGSVHRILSSVFQMKNMPGVPSVTRSVSDGTNI